jgi:hypothetical protein
MVKTFKIECKNGTQSHHFHYNSEEENGDYDIEHFDEDIDENEFDFEESNSTQNFQNVKYNQSVVSFIFFNVLTNRIGTKLKFSLNTE